MYDDHMYCEDCGEHERECWCFRYDEDPKSIWCNCNLEEDG